MRHIAFQGKAQRLKRRALCLGRNAHTHQRLHAIGIQLVGAAGIRHSARNHNLGRLTACMIQDHAGGMLNPLRRPRGVNPAFKPVPRIRIDLERATRIGCAHRIKIRGFNEHIRGLGRTAGRKPAHHATNALDTLGVRNQRHTFGKSIFLVVQRHERFATHCAMHTQGISRDLVRIKHVQRTIAVIGKEVRYIDKERNRPQPNGAQRILQPNRRRPVFHTPDHPTVKHRTLLKRILVYRHSYGTGKCALNRRTIACLERAQTTRGQITGNAPHTQRIRPVRRNRNLDHRINLGGIIHRQPVNERLPDLPRRQFNNSVMLF